MRTQQVREPNMNRAREQFVSALSGYGFTLRPVSDTEFTVVDSDRPPPAGQPAILELPGGLVEEFVLAIRDDPISSFDDVVWQISLTLTQGIRRLRRAGVRREASGEVVWFEERDATTHIPLPRGGAIIANPPGRAPRGRD